MDDVLPGSWKLDDMLYTYKKHKVVLFNIPRDQEFHHTHKTVLESMSDGGAKLSTKYESVIKKIQAVVIVFANIPPPIERLPKRCITYNLDVEPVVGVVDTTGIVPKGIPPAINAHRTQGPMHDIERAINV